MYSSEKYKEWYRKNIVKKRKQVKEWQLLHKEHIKKRDKKYRLSHKEQINKTQKIYYHKHKKNNINFKLAVVLRTRIRLAIKNNNKILQSNQLLGCSIDELKQHLEKQFKLGMSWDNYGYNGWHIDHIKPCASFDLSIEEEQRKCFHYTNLQPLWAEENLQKGDK